MRVGHAGSAVDLDRRRRPRARAHPARRPAAAGDPGPVPRPALDQGRGLRRGARARAGRGLPGHGRRRSGSPSSRMLAEDYGADRGADPGRRRGLPRRAEPGRGPGPAPRLRGAAPRAVPADEHRARRHPGDRRPAHAAARASCRTIPSWRRSTPTSTTCSAAGSTRASSPSPGSTGTARPRCWRSSCATRRSTGCGRWRT